MLWPRLSVTVPGEYDFFPSVLIVVVTFDELQPDSESLHLPVIVTSLLVQIFGLDDNTTVDGVVSFSDLKNGETYYLKEIKAPSGYQKLDRVYCIKTDFIPVNGQYDVYVDQEKVDGLYADGSVNLEFVNERMTKLPHTGSSMSLVCVVVGAYLMLRRNHE